METPTDASASPEAFREIVTHLPAALYTTDGEGWITYFNEAAVDLWGRRPALGEDRWCGSWKLFWPDGAPLPHEDCPMAITVKTGKPVRGAEAVAERPDGSRFSFTPFPTPMFDANGKLTGAVNIMVEIPGSRRAAEEVPRHARRLSRADRVAVAVARDNAIASLFDQTARMVHRQQDALSPVQWAALRYLARTTEARDETEIANYLGVSVPSITRDVSLLLRHGFVGRITHPPAASKLTIADAGRTALQLDPLKRLAQAIARLSEDRRAALAADLESIADELSRDGK